MINDTVSVIIPVYNSEKYIVACLESIVHQKVEHIDLELIIVDDGSTDQSGRICDEYTAKYDNIQVIHTKNRGVASARNEGLKKATGDYICFVDSDDFLFSDFFARMFEIQKEYTADIVQCNCITFKRASSLKRNDDHYQISVLSNIEACRRIYDDPGTMWYGFLWGKIFRRELYKDIKFPDGRVCEDQAVTYKLIYKANRFVNTDEVLYGYRFSENSIMRQHIFNIKVFYDDITAINEAILFYKAHMEDLLESSAIAYRDFLKAKYSIKCRASHQYKKVLRNYKMNFFKACLVLQRYRGEDYFEWFMNPYYPIFTKICSKFYHLKTILRI